MVRGALFLRVLPCVVLATLLVACGGPEIALTGKVTDAYTGKPVPGAALMLGTNQLTADRSGTYQISKWSAQDTLQVSANGYEPAHIALAVQPGLANPTPPAVTLDTTIRPNTLAGIITDGYSGKPLAGATVAVSATLSATTGADGRYTLAGVPENVTLNVSAPDHDPISQSVAHTTAFDAPLRPNLLVGVVTDQYTNQPVADATIKIGSTSATTGSDGRYQFKGVPETADVQISAKGYAAVTQTLAKATTLDAVLRPDTLLGALVDAKSGAVIKNATVIVAPSPGATPLAMVRIDNSTDGKFTLENAPEQGIVEILAPGYRKATIEIKSGSVPTTIKLEPISVRGLYITVAMASSTKRVKEFMDIIDRTELNAIVIDLKSDLRDDLGTVYYDSQVPLVKELKTSRDIMDIKAILAEAKKRGIYTIARVAMFSHDNMLAEAKPEWAAKDRTTGGVFADYPGPGIHYDWLDPWNQNVWDYNIALSVEAAQMGFDEINFDYIRFPSLEFSANDKNRLQLSHEPSTSQERFANIGAVLERAQKAINGAGAYLSVDVFGYTAWGPGGLIGQNLSIMGQHTDYIMPMIYPSHFNYGELGFDNPAAHPYEMILASMQKGVTQVAGTRAQLRPWLQDFTLTWVPKNLIVEYGPEQVRAQIKAMTDYDKNAGWMLYDSANQYTEEALGPPEK